MTIDEVVAFVAVAEWGGFTEASMRLNLSQPAVSRRVRELERSLGAPLYERAGRRVRLTAAGRALLPHAEAVLATVRDAERAVREEVAREGETRSLGLAIVGTLADSHLVDALRAFESRSPDVAVELTTATSRQVSALVRTGEASLGLRYFPDADPRLESIPLGAERLVVVVPAGHPLTAGRLPGLEALHGERWLGFSPERGQPDSFGHLLDRLLPEGTRVTRIDSLTAQKRLAQAGLGVALMPVSSVHEELRIGSLRTVEVDGLEAWLPVVAVRRRGGHRGPLTEAFLEMLREHTPGLRC
ncbi:LysR family transcriptional regulator [Nonomuraea sp. MCN248]|uniref:LysR family transcriptional regulator n=1 Tax=Nonomuraea corallina TaxID=2989783 RepID=A0ABT4SC58_9ACTN|nr:LysR family transcriptional regulator [Nonomuraea corallina]MDA0634786.1 LysR family transcriptional regulator [Nonomuraea corallina]